MKASDGLAALGENILVNERGDASTRDGLQTNLWKVVKALVTEGLVKPRLCFHGLRHSLGTALYDLGLDIEAHKAALGHTSDALDAHITDLVDKAKNAK